ncbi:MAG: tripartite tricarboxylate transporter substrate binding protein [Acetobacteraceae bacterium]|nr:tripartite tricarboxylate transporter substrate binding protein [Acetobacteraceae bacterium]
MRLPRRGLMAAGTMATGLPPLLATAPRPARAQQGDGGLGFPSRNLRWIVPFPPGGASDALVRVIATPLGVELGRPVVVENRGGAGTTLGTAEALRAPPDGHTLLLAALPFVINQFAMPSLPYDPERDFTPVGLLATAAVVLVARPGLARDWAGVVAAARARPGALTYASAGNGSLPHVAFEQLKLRSGLDILHVPYRGGGPAVIDLVAGRVDLMLASPVEVVGQVQAGQLVPIASASARRIALWPELPTLQEAGVPEMDVNGWFGVVAATATPEPALARLNAALRAVLEQPEVRGRIAELGAVAAPGPREAYAAMLAAERRRWAETVRAARIRIE